MIFLITPPFFINFLLKKLFFFITSPFIFYITFEIITFFK